MELCYCFLEKFNNYFNRKIIKYDNVDDYLSHSNDSFIPLDKQGNYSLFNFDPNDNVMTAIVCNDVPFDPDYFLLIDKENNIKQRWFIMEQKRNRQGQWVYTLKRDVICDNFNTLLNAPIFVQKGMLSENDPMIFNSEGMEFNQIKKSETLLKDMSKTAWVVCYLSKSMNSSDVNVSISTEVPEHVSLLQIANELGMSEADLASALNINPGDTNKLILTDYVKLMYAMKDGILSYLLADYEFNASFSSLLNKYSSPSGITTNLFDSRNWNVYAFSYFENNVISKNVDIVNNMPVLLGRSYYLTKSKAKPILDKYNGKIILYLGNYYTLNISTAGSGTYVQNFLPSQNSLWNEICQKTANQIIQTTYKNTGDINLDVHDEYYELALTAYTPATKQYKLKIPSSRNVCNKQQFDMLAIPYSALTIINSGTPITQPEEVAQMIASKLAIQEGTNIYDIQLLPYCPRQDMITGDNEITLDDFTAGEDYSFIIEDDNGNETNVGIVLYPEEASFTTQINHQLVASEGNKIDSQCNFYRIASPNYQGSFEFNVARNGGSVEFFTCYCTYKPYTPFIKVTPNLKGLYGSDYNDNRGLICGGDFSLPRASSAWEQYQLENKNYQNIFNREIQNLSFMQSIERRNQLISGAVGILGDTAKGATAGAIAGGPYGAIAGGIIGGTTSAVGYAIDTDTLAKVQRETRQLAIDKYNYQLGNIKALPYTLTKVGAFDVASKIFPFLEYYTCTDTEKDALRNKIRYESMTVMRIGTLDEFRDFENQLNYFKGELIRNDDIADDPHTLNAIYEEFLKGVYI